MKWATRCWDLLGVILIVSQMAAPENVYVQTPVDWHSALQTCRSQGRQLGLARSRDLTEFSGAAGSSVGAWVGGKRVYSRWVWVDNMPLYTHYGCFSDSAVGPKVSAVTQSTQYVYQCLAACGTFSVALKLDVCWCLSGVPDVSLRLSDDSCQTSCTGRFDEMCGDVTAYSIYQRDRLPYILGNFQRVLSTAKETSKCGYIEYVSSDNKTYTLLFDECGDNPASNKRQMCQQCQVTNQETNKQTCVVGKWLGVATWAKTKTFCESMQMNMTTAASENLFLSFTVAKKPFWVGLRLDVVLSWVNGLAINPQNYRTALNYVDGNCLAAVTGKAGALQLQLENCDKSKPYFCDIDFPTISDTSTDSSQSVGSTAPSTQTLDYTINTHLPEYTVSTQLTHQEQSSSQTDPISSSQITIHTSTIQLTKYTSSVELTKHETSSSHIPEFETSSSQSTEFETSSKQIIKDTSTSKMVGITTNSQPGDYETSSTRSVDMTTSSTRSADMTTSSTHLEDTTSTKTREETTGNINPTATFSETTNAASPSPTPVLTSTSSLIMSSVMTTNILLSMTPSQSPTNRSTSSLSTSFHTTLIITSFTFSQISESRASQITFTMQPVGTSASSVLSSSIFNTAKQSTNILVESSSTPTIDLTSKISSSTHLSTIEKSTIIQPTIEKSSMIQPTIQSTNKISSSPTMIESTIEHTNMPTSRTTQVTEQTRIISSTIKETHMSLLQTTTTTTTETTNRVSSPTMIIITIGETKTLSLPITQPTSGVSLSETKTPSTESTVTSLFPSTTVQQSRISQPETVILASPSPSTTTEPTNTLDSTSTMQLENTVATSTNVLPPSTVETTKILPSSATKTSQTTTSVLTETETSTIPAETSTIPTETSTIPTETSTIPTETSQTYTQQTHESYSEHSRTSQPDSRQSQSDHTTQSWTSASVNPIPGSTPHTTGSAPTHTAAPVKTQDNSAGNKNDIGRSDLLPIYISLGVCLGILVVLVAVTVTLLLRKSHRSTPTSSSWRSSSMNSTSSSKELVSFRPEPRLRARLASERL